MHIALYVHGTLWSQLILRDFVDGLVPIWHQASCNNRDKFGQLAHIRSTPTQCFTSWHFCVCHHHAVKQLWYVTTHYNDVIMSAMASQITSLAIVYSSVYSRRRSKKISKLRVTSLYVGNSPVTVTRKMFPDDDVIMLWMRWLDKLHIHISSSWVGNYNVNPWLWLFIYALISMNVSMVERDPSTRTTHSFTRPARN